MRALFFVSAVLIFCGCNSEPVTTHPEASPSSVSENIAPVTPAPVVPVAPPVANDQKLPFDMPIMPGARYLSGLDFSKPTKRRGPEAIATIIAKGTTLEVVSFYEKALVENGFTPTVGKHNSESSAKVSGVRENGDTLSINSMRKGSKASDGECQTSFVATKPKPAENEE